MLQKLSPGIIVLALLALDFVWEVVLGTVKVNVKEDAKVIVLQVVLRNVEQDAGKHVRVVVDKDVAEAALTYVLLIANLSVKEHVVLDVLDVLILVLVHAREHVGMLVAEVVMELLDFSDGY